MKVSPLSLMPEDLEKQIQPQELADLFALLTLDRPPTDPAARKLPGSQAIPPREATNDQEYDELLRQIAPGFAMRKPTKVKMAIVAEHAGRESVLRTGNECSFSRSVVLPQGKRTRLVMSVSHEDQEPWQLVVSVNGKRVREWTIESEGQEPTWQTLSIDLTDHARNDDAGSGGKATIEVLHRAPFGKRSAAYWGHVEIVSD
jgi:hypothetical protein